MKRLFIKKNNATANTGYWDHLVVNSLFAFLVMAALLIRRNGYSIEVLAGMAYSTLLASPDMDSGRSVVYRNWLIFRFAWLPYTILFKHRGNDLNLVFNTKRGIGHNMILGTAFRVGYAFLLLYLSSCLMPEILTWINKGNGNRVGYLVLGIWLADGCHILVDWLVHKN